VGHTQESMTTHGTRDDTRDFTAMLPGQQLDWSATKGR